MKKILFKVLLLVLCLVLSVSTLVACGDNNESSVATDGLVFAQTDGGDLAITGYTGTATKIVIPEKHDGKTVVLISESAFADNESIAEVTIGAGVTFIEEYAFKNCSALKKVEIPDEITSVDFSAFVGCDALEYNKEGALTYLGNTENPYVLLIGAEKTAEDVTVNDGCKIIGVGAFENCSVLTSVKLPKKLSRISGYAFSGATSLKVLNYFGTEDEWNKIVLDANWKSGSKILGVVAYGSTITLD